MSGGNEGVKELKRPTARVTRKGDEMGALRGAFQL